MRDFKLPKGEIMLGRIRYFSDGMVIGSRKFLKKAYAKFAGEIIRKKTEMFIRPGLT
jgi:hypothetical protein